MYTNFIVYICKVYRVNYVWVFTISAIVFLGCSEGLETVEEQENKPSIIRIGNEANVNVNLEGPMLFLMGKGSPDTEAFDHFMVDLSREGVGDVVVIAASFASGQSRTPECDTLIELASVNSCTTITIRSVKEANNPDLVQVIGSAGAVYFAGGNQCNYMKWRGTELMDAVTSLHGRGGGVGGGSAGLAIQGEWVYDGCTGSIRSDEALENPYDSFMSLSEGVFSWPVLSGWITDSHFSERDRLGRLIAFQARIMQAEQSDSWLGIGLDDDSAVVVSNSGITTVYGADSYVVKTTQPAKTLVQGTPLTIQGVKVYRFGPGSQFQMDDFDLDDEPEIYSVEEGVLQNE